MKAIFVLKMLITAFVIALGLKLGFQEVQSWRESKLASDLCSLVGNYLEVGSLREAFEGLERGLHSSGKASACVSVIDNGRSFAPICGSPGIKYQTVTCYAEGNTGVRAEIHFPITPLFDFSFIFLWLACVGLIGSILAATQGLGSRLIARLSIELELRLFTETNEERSGILSRAVDWIIVRTGLLKSVQQQGERFETRLQEFELRVREEAALRAKNEAEAAKSTEYVEKVNQIRHDIRSPLTSLLALMDAFDGDELMRQTLASTISQIQTMVEDLDQVEGQQAEPKLTILEVVAEEVVARLRPRFLQTRRVQLKLDYDGAQLSPAIVEPGGLRRVFDNLLENAFDAVSEGGAISLSIHKTDSHCRITVEDNGCGIAADRLSKLFSKEATHGKINGGGLGLYHCKRSIESWSGTITCEPLARGTRFKIELPLVQTGVTFVGLKGLERIMVIDDDNAVSRALSHSGFNVMGVASSFSEGRALLTAPRGAGVTVLVDQDLGDGKYGTDLVAGHGERQGVVLCTNGYDDPELVRRARQVGVNILPKPLCFFATAPARPGRPMAVQSDVNRPGPYAIPSNLC